MRRDIDLLRRIVLAVEDLPGGSLNTELEIDGYTREQIGYHSYLLIDAGLAQGRDATYLEGTSPVWHINHLTSKGHDFADAARSEGIWNKAKTKIKEQGGSFTVELLKDLLVRLIKGSMGLE
jgi:hypothetical protein